MAGRVLLLVQLVLIEIGPGLKWLLEAEKLVLGLDELVVDLVHRLLLILSLERIAPPVLLFQLLLDISLIDADAFDVVLHEYLVERVPLHFQLVEAVQHALRLRLKDPLEILLLL